jgi:hypothetical protein
MAFCLDRFASIGTEWPLAINEQVVSFNRDVRTSCGIDKEWL